MAVKNEGLNVIGIGTDSDESGFFDSEIDLIPIAEFCSRYGYSKKTVYDWKYRQKQNKIPNNLIVKFRGKLYIRIDVFKQLVLFDSIL